MTRLAKRRIARAKGRAEEKRSRPFIAAPLPPEDAERIAKAGPGSIVWLSKEATTIFEQRNRRRQ